MPASQDITGQRLGRLVAIAVVLLICVGVGYSLYPTGNRSASCFAKKTSRDGGDNVTI